MKKIDWLEATLSMIAGFTFMLIFGLICADELDKEMVRREKEAGVYDASMCIFAKNCK